MPSSTSPSYDYLDANLISRSQLECNLIVICGTVPTLKKFLRHVSPKVLGSSGGGDSGNTPNVMRSNVHGRGKRRNTYAKFGENVTDFEMTQWDREEASRKGGVSTTVSGGSSRPKSEDENSEKAIMESRPAVERH